MSRPIPIPPAATVPCLTINTDASFHPTHKVGGYAFYMVCDLFTIKGKGPFHARPKDSTEAEIMAIGNALATILKLPELRVGVLVINCDAKFAMHAVEVNPRSGLAKKVAAFKNKVAKHLGNPRIEFRHVKAHNGTPDARSWVNDWCDKEAKAAMWAAFHGKSKPKPKKKKPVFQPRNNNRRPWSPYKD